MNDSSNTANLLESIQTNPGSLVPAGRWALFLDWLRWGLSTLLILAGLGGVACWGHHNGWKVPAFSSLRGNVQGQDRDWCVEHNVPESGCVECKPELLPRPKAPAWCKKHGVHDCPLCYPGLAEVAGRAQPPRYDVLAALNLLARPENDSRCKLHLRRIQFASEAAVAKAGVDVEVVQEAPVAETVAANGEIAYDPTRVARLSSRVPGSVWRVEKALGQDVRKGEVLALVDAAEVGKVKGEFLQALAEWTLHSDTLQRLLPLYSKGATSEAAVRQAEAAQGQARIRLSSAQQALANLGLPIQADDLRGLAADEVSRRVRFLGLPEAVVRTIDPGTTTANLIPVVSPLDGVVVERAVVAGEVVDPAKPLFVVADPRRLWLTLHVRLEDARYLALGQPLRFRADGGAGGAGERPDWFGMAQDPAGAVTWISPAVDEKTRTVQVRADLDNRQGRLWANTFGFGRVLLREERNAVVVPRGAVQWEGCCHVVFVRDRNYLEKGTPKVFHVRTVRVGATGDRDTELLAGALPGEVVASKGSGVLLAELLKGKLGEG